ncbi:hypothetical protein Tco_0755093 [Tanacetum coccineum]
MLNLVLLDPIENVSNCCFNRFFCTSLMLSFPQILALWLSIKIYASTASWKTEKMSIRVWQKQYIKAFLLFLLALQQVKSLAADTEGDAGISCVWFPLVIMSHSMCSVIAIYCRHLQDHRKISIDKSSSGQEVLTQALIPLVGSIFLNETSDILQLYGI